MKKNVIILHTDQQRADSLGCMGNPHVKTPNLDRLAAEGSLFRRHIVANPVCTPSRASLLTGLYPPGHGCWTNGIALPRREYHPEHNLGGDPYEPTTMADMFAAAGYDTASFGKLHLTPNRAPREYGYPETFELWRDGTLKDWRGPYYGFRHVELTHGHGKGPCDSGPYREWLLEKHPDAARDLEEKTPTHPPAKALKDLWNLPIPYEAHHSAWLAERVLAYATTERQMDCPFFAFVGFPDPHHPFTPCQESMDLFNDAPVRPPWDPEGTGPADNPMGKKMQTKYGDVPPEDFTYAQRSTYAMIYQIDRAVGSILDGLEEAGLLEETIIVFTSDHGDFLGDHGLIRKGFGASHSLLNVPFILRAPGEELPDQVDTPMSNCDVMPTLAALTGVTPPAHLDGADITARLRGGDPQYACAFSSGGGRTSTNMTIYDERFRLTWYPADDYVELFDHRKDPGETTNVADLPAHLDSRRTLLQRLQERFSTSWMPCHGRRAAW
ncbi:MAG: sulfatase family protein [Planctomycetota bacterium]|jgi:arylsulfatase A-like enzyme